MAPADRDRDSAWAAAEWVGAAEAPEAEQALEAVQEARVVVSVAAQPCGNPTAVVAEAWEAAAAAVVAQVLVVVEARASA